MRTPQGFTRIAAGAYMVEDGPWTAILTIDRTGVPVIRLRILPGPLQPMCWTIRTPDPDAAAMSLAAMEERLRAAWTPTLRDAVRASDAIHAALPDGCTDPWGWTGSPDARAYDTTGTE